MKLKFHGYLFYITFLSSWASVIGNWNWNRHLVALVLWMNIGPLILGYSLCPQNVEVTAAMSSVDPIHVSKPGTCIRHISRSNMGTAFTSFSLIFGGSKSCTHVYLKCLLCVQLGMGKVKSWIKNWILWSVLTIVVVIRFPQNSLFRGSNFSLP